MTPVQSEALTRLVEFGFDVLICSVKRETELTRGDIIISVDTNAPDWTMAKMESLCFQCGAYYTFYTDLDRVHGYIYSRE